MEIRNVTPVVEHPVVPRPIYFRMTKSKKMKEELHNVAEDIIQVGIHTGNVLFVVSIRTFIVSRCWCDCFYNT